MAAWSRLTGCQIRNKQQRLELRQSMHLADARKAILDLYQQGQLTVTVSKAYPFTLAAVKQAHLDFEQGGNQGKRVIVFDQETTNV